jgi:hypothetical protein
MFKKSVLLMMLNLTAWTSLVHAEPSGREPGPVASIIPYTSYYEKGDLPPRLIAVFRVDCSDYFQGVVRHDSYDPGSQSIMISIGGQIRALKTGCRGSMRTVEVDAGPTYSGRRFLITQLNPTPLQKR